MDNNLVPTLKFLLVALLTLAACVASVFFFVGALRGEPVYLSLAIGSILLFSALYTLQVVFSPRSFVAYLVVFVQAFGSIFLLLSSVTLGTMSIVLAGAVVLFICLILAQRSGRTYLENSLTIRFSDAAKSVYHRAVTGMLIFLSVISYLILFVWGGGFSVISERIVSGIVSQSEQILRIYFPGVTFNGTVDEFVSGLVRSQISSLTGSAPALANASVSDAVIAETSRGLKARFEKTLGPLRGDESVARALSGALLRFADSIPEQFRVPAYLVVCLIIFWLLKSTFSLVGFVGVFVSWVFFKALILCKFARIEVKTREQEIVTL